MNKISQKKIEKEKERNKKFEKADDLAEQVLEITEINIFKNTRKNKYIEARAMLNFFLYNTLHFSLTDIADFYKTKGKKYNHATALHSLNNFDVYRRYNKNVVEWMDEIEDTKFGLFSKKANARQMLSFLNKEYTNLAYNRIKDLYDEQESIKATEVIDEEHLEITN